MRKRTKHITKKELKHIISEIVNRVLEKKTANTNIDISDIDINVLRDAYRDLRLTPKVTSFDDILSDLPGLNENFGDVLPADEVVEKIRKKYYFSSDLVKKVEAENKISVYVVIALVGINVTLIERDMDKMGYFLGLKQPPQTVNGMTFQVLQFEPKSEKQNDETELIKSKYKMLFHWTPLYLYDIIMKNGLIPDCKNGLYRFPPRIYLIKGDSTPTELYNLGQKLCSINGDSRNNGEYALLGIDITKLEDNVCFYLDPNSDIGVYTEDKIPSNIIKLIEIRNFEN